MSEETNTTHLKNPIEVVAFYVGNMLCAVECNTIREILNEEKITHVYHAPDYVKGVVNIRGQIVTIVDLKKILDIPSSTVKRKNRIIVTQFRDESIGLQVDSVEDILIGNRQQLSNPPSHLGNLKGSFIHKIMKTDENLVAILNTEKILDTREV